MDIETYSWRERLLKLQKELLAIEENRLDGHSACIVDELEDYLAEAIAEA